MLNSRKTITISAIIIASITLSGCTASENSTSSSKTESTAAFTASPTTGEKVDTTGLDLKGNEAHQKLLEVLAYSEKTATNSGYVETNSANGQENIFIYSPAEQKAFAYDVTGGQKMGLDDKTMLSVFGIKGFTEYFKNKMSYTLKDNIFTIEVASTKQSAVIYVKDGLIVKTEQVEDGTTASVSDMVYSLSDAELVMINEILNQPPHAHDSSGNDVAQ